MWGKILFLRNKTIVDRTFTFHRGGFLENGYRIEFVRVEDNGCFMGGMGFMGNVGIVGIVGKVDPFYPSCP